MEIGFPKPKPRQKKTPARRQLEDALKSTRPNKFSAVRQDGFPSKLERGVYGQLCFREKAGEIRELRRYPSVDLGFGIRWKVDFAFVVCATGQETWCEAKGKWDAEARLKLKLWENGLGPGPLEVWRAEWGGEPYLERIVIPKENPK